MKLLILILGNEFIKVIAMMGDSSFIPVVTMFPFSAMHHINLAAECI